jgi:hypothetical protein
VWATLTPNTFAVSLSLFRGIAMGPCGTSPVSAVLCVVSARVTRCRGASFVGIRVIRTGVSSFCCNWRSPCEGTVVSSVLLATGFPFLRFAGRRRGEKRSSGRLATTDWAIRNRACRRRAISVSIAARISCLSTLMNIPNRDSSRSTLWTRSTDSAHD